MGYWSVNISWLPGGRQYCQYSAWFQSKYCQIISCSAENAQPSHPLFKYRSSINLGKPSHHNTGIFWAKLQTLNAPLPTKPLVWQFESENMNNCKQKK